MTFVTMILAPLAALWFASFMAEVGLYLASKS